MEEWALDPIIVLRICIQFSSWKFSPSTVRPDLVPQNAERKDIHFSIENAALRCYHFQTDVSDKFDILARFLVEVRRFGQVHIISRASI